MKHRFLGYFWGIFFRFILLFSFALVAAVGCKLTSEENNGGGYSGLQFNEDSRYDENESLPNITAIKYGSFHTSSCGTFLHVNEILSMDSSGYLFQNNACSSQVSVSSSSVEVVDFNRDFKIYNSKVFAKFSEADVDALGIDRYILCRKVISSTPIDTGYDFVIRRIGSSYSLQGIFGKIENSVGKRYVTSWYQIQLTESSSRISVVKEGLNLRIEKTSGVPMGASIELQLADGSEQSFNLSCYDSSQ